ncbi:MAG TPA: shikimate dehydrogenase [Candidatus Acidoferrales bacterium]|nr:shikimate dehydrogenase [Candidatus Acidoferrales bacterium]
MPNELFFGKNRVCAVVAARTAREASRQLREALRHTSTVELRLDWLANSAEIRKLFAFLRKRSLASEINLIATCRRAIAGGKFTGDAVAQLSLLRSAITAGCRWADVEIETVESVPGFALDLYTARARRILSWHDFSGLPDSKGLARITRHMTQLCADRRFDAIKVAAKCESLHDSLRLLALARHRRNVIAVPMGDAATPMRILAVNEGSALSYAPVEQATAPGQIALAELRELYRGGNFTRKTRVFGVIGDPIAHSLSPAIFNGGFHARKIDAVFLPFRVTDMDDFIAAIHPLGIAGFSVTLPHKQEILDYLHHCEPVAYAIGAVNTGAVRANGKLFGYNTDSIGVLRALTGRLTIRGSRVLILGAGGAARAAAFTLAREGSSVSVCSRRIEKARQLARAVDGAVVPRHELETLSFDAVINATPVGMHPHEGESPLAASEMNCALAFDMIYRPRRTKFLQLAAERGIKTVSGLQMFLAQAMAQWEIWFGGHAPAAAMRRAVLVALRRDERRNEKTT